MTDTTTQRPDPNDGDALLAAIEDRIAAGEDPAAVIAASIRANPDRAKEIAALAVRRYMMGELPQQNSAREGADELIAKVGKRVLGEFGDTPLSSNVDALTSIVAAAAERGWDTAEFARRLRLDTSTLEQLNRGDLPPDHIPRLLVQWIADALQRSFTEVAGYLRSLTQQPPSGQLSLVREKAAAYGQDTWTSPTLSEEDRAFWSEEVAQGRLLGE